jgi:Fe-S-cluster-containing dehydrogenase component
MVEVVYLPVTCNHCDDAPCIKAARDGAVKKRPDGIVIIDPVKAKGQRQLVDACPYKAIWWNEQKDLPQAWPFDAHLLDAGWTKTRGAQACATQAMRALHVDDEEMQRIAREEGLQVLHPEYRTKPRVYYKNLDRFYKAFIGEPRRRDRRSRGMRRGSSAGPEARHTDGRRNEERRIW